MPIRPEMRALYPADWPQISGWIRFERAKGCCEQCGRPHGRIVRCLPDGRWFDPLIEGWRTQTGALANAWPDIEDYCWFRTTRVILAACHKDHDPANNDPDNLIALCQRCHLIHDRPEHRRRIRLTILQRRALGDLFLGLYRHHLRIAEVEVVSWRRPT
ncbi:HNH endonuclease signature motif containing protein [Fodinicurvata sp. EGI_FJ10296]|uniref:HNH endonuclease signature motif containing protein n=1 Tax=Fodinicurvata sp. EGI_FJ10296 TaxID=3231908 RepID=UPI003451ADF2